MNTAMGETSAAARLRLAIDARAQAEIDEAVAITEFAAENEWPVHAEIELVGQRPARLGADGTPLLNEFVALEVAALKGISVAAATWLIRDLVNLRWRHPRLWGRLRAGAVPVFRACQLAAEIARFDLTGDQLQQLDEQLAHAAPGLPWRRLVNLCRGLIADLVPDQIVERSRQARAERYVRALPTDDPTVGYLSARVDTADAVFFDAMVDRIADLLGSHGDTDSKDIRRARSVGILATPARATLLLAEAAGQLASDESHGHPSTPSATRGMPSAAGCPQPDPAGPDVLFVLDGWPDQTTGSAATLPDDAAAGPGDHAPGEPGPPTRRPRTATGRSAPQLAPPRVSSTASGTPNGFPVTDQKHPEEANTAATVSGPVERPTETASRGRTNADSTESLTEAGVRLLSEAKPLATTSLSTLDQQPQWAVARSSTAHDAGQSADPGAARQPVTRDADPVAQVWRAAEAALPTIRWTDPKLLPTSTLYLHIAEDTLMSGKGPVRAEAIGPLTTSLLALLVGHTRITVKPVIRPYDTIAVDAYEIPNRIRDQVILRNHIEVFPYSSRPARNQQLDHTIAYRNGEVGQTRASNLGPLSTKVHRAKTHGHWNLSQPAPGVFWWKSPAGNHYRTTPNGTMRLRNDSTLDRAFGHTLWKIDSQPGGREIQ